MGTIPRFQMTAPTELSDRTRGAMVRQMMSERDPDFRVLYHRTTDSLKEVFRTQSDVIIMHGEAILGLEAALVCLMEEGDKCLTLVSGSYGGGFVQWVRALGGHPIEIRVPYNSAIDPADVEKALHEHPDIKLLTLVHCETLSGTVNPTQDICPLAKEHGVVSIVDAVTSVGSVETRVEEWGMDVCIVGSQKCLAAPPGLALVSVSEDAWSVMRAKKHPVRYSYLSMLDWKELWLEGGRFPYDLSVSSVYGLSEALDQVLEEGLEQVISRHGRAAHACREGIKGMGLELWPASEEIAAASATAVKLPEGVEAAHLCGHMLAKYGVAVTPGFREMEAQLVGVAHMGVTANPMHIIVALAALEKSLADLGYPTKLGEGVRAALEVI